jgi:CubicO group peptidase (beta-lactamase class C family)
MKKGILIRQLLLYPAVLIAGVGRTQPASGGRPGGTVTRPDGVVLTTAAIDSTVQRLMDAAEVTGLCLGIVQDGQVRYVKAYGYKNKPMGEWNDTATCFYGASLSKAVFARLVMQLVDEGRIDLDKPLCSYLPKPLPEYDRYKDLAGDDRWRLITARMCLDHTTGFPNWRQFNPRHNNKLEIFFKPGQRYAYSGEGLYLLQMVVETITGRPLEDLAQEKIFLPSGMRRTSYVWQPAFGTDYAVGHNMNQDTLPKHRRSTANAAGSMETTIADYTRFMAAVIRGDSLSAKARQAMLTPQIAIYSKRQFPSLDNAVTDDNRSIGLSYGLGWGLFNSAYGRVFFKEGHDDGWQHYSIGFPDKGVAFVLMANSDFAESIYKELVERLTGVTIPWYWEGYK